MKKNYISGITTLGYKWKIDADTLKDFFFLKALKKMGNDDPLTMLDGIEEVVSVLFNDVKKEEEFYKFLASKNGGRVPSNVLMTEVKDIITGLKEDKEIKNS